tara:strand:- start:1520 stop:1786 length:267 start_codon:yes stop_codon:yes gene_type:complete
MTRRRTLDDSDVDMIRTLYRERAITASRIKYLKGQISRLESQMKHVSPPVLARKFGVSQQHIYRIIHNQQRPEASEASEASEAGELDT